MSFTTGMPFFDMMFAEMDRAEKARQRANFGITEVDGFWGCERLNIPHIFDDIGGFDKYLDCKLDGKSHIYKQENGEFLFECFKFYYKGQGMFTVQEEESHIFSLYNEGKKVSKAIYSCSHLNYKFNEYGYGFINLDGYSKGGHVLDKEGNVLFEVKKEYCTIKGITCNFEIDSRRTYFEIPSGLEICKKPKFSSSDHDIETDDWLFVKSGKNCIHQINIHTAEFTIIGEPDKEEEVKVPERVAAPPKQIEPPQPKVQRNDPCPCGSGKKYKNCCLKNQ